MSDPNETKWILNAEAQERLRKDRDAELAKIVKLRLVLDNIQKLRTRSMDLPDEGENVQRALKVLSATNYLGLSNSGDDCLLDLNELQNSVSLTYTERKSIREGLTSTIQVNLLPIVQYGREMKTEMPELFANNCISPTTSTQTESPSSLEILQLVTQHRNNMQKLVELRNRKCAYLKAAAELKMGPYLVRELELLHTEVRLSQVKANVLHDYFVNILLTRTDQSLKAVKEVGSYVDEELDKYKGEC